MREPLARWDAAIQAIETGARPQLRRRRHARRARRRLSRSPSHRRRRSGADRGGAHRPRSARRPGVARPRLRPRRKARRGRTRTARRGPSRSAQRRRRLSAWRRRCATPAKPTRRGRRWSGSCGCDPRCRCRRCRHAAPAVRIAVRARRALPAGGRCRAALCVAHGWPRRSRGSSPATTPRSRRWRRAAAADAAVAAEHRRGLDAWVAGDHNAALRELQRAIELRPGDERPRLALAFVAARGRTAERGRAGTARRDCGVPAGGPALVPPRAAARGRSRACPRPRTPSRKASRAGPSWGATRCISGWRAFASTRRTSTAAIAAYEARVSINPNSAEAHRSLGEIYFLQGRDDGGAGGVPGRRVARSQRRARLRRARQGARARGAVRGGRAGAAPRGRVRRRPCRRALRARAGAGPPRPRRGGAARDRRVPAARRRGARARPARLPDRAGPGRVAAPARGRRRGRGARRSCAASPRRSRRTRGGCASRAPRSCAGAGSPRRSRCWKRRRPGRPRWKPRGSWPTRTPRRGTPPRRVSTRRATTRRCARRA